MGTSERAVAAGPLVLALTFALALAPARGQETPPHAIHLEAQRSCVNQKERRALVETGAVLQLAAALHAVRSHIAGTLVRARLCHRGDGFAYVLTVLAHDGKVTRVVVDAAKGTLVGER
jgi:uncharacterized membrane protein YkoI